MILWALRIVLRPVRDGDNGPAPHETVETLHHLVLRLSIRAPPSVLVQYENRRVADERARDADPLPLTARHRDSPFADQSMVDLPLPVTPTIPTN
jgi:hypothetical protein